MSIWTSKALLVAVLLSGCVAADGGTGTSAPPRTIALGGLKVAGPQGFCPVQNARQRVGNAEFVALAPCDGGQGAILAATIGAPGSADGLRLTSAVLAPYFGTPEGQRALRGEGSTDVIKVHEVQDLGGAVVLRLTRDGAGQGRDSWRALMQVQGQLITLTVRPRQGGSLPASEGQRLISRFVTAMRRVNGA